MYAHGRKDRATLRAELACPIDVPRTTLEPDWMIDVHLYGETDPAETRDAELLTGLLHALERPIECDRLLIDLHVHSSSVTIFS